MMPSSAISIKTGRYSIKFCGSIDRRYQQGYINPDHGRFTFFKDIVWTTNDFNLVKGLVSVYNTSAHRNHRELQNIYTIVQILPIVELGITEEQKGSSSSSGGGNSSNGDTGGNGGGKVWCRDIDIR